MPNSWNRFFRLLPLPGTHPLTKQKIGEEITVRENETWNHAHPHASLPLAVKPRSPFVRLLFPGEGGQPSMPIETKEEYLGKVRNAMRFRRHGVWTRNHATFCGSLRSCTVKISRVGQETRRPAAFSRFPEFVDSSPRFSSFRCARK